MATATVYAAFAARVERTPDAIAVVCDETRLTYRELERDAGRLASRLRACGVGAGSLVGVYLDRGESLIIAMLAIVRAGAAYLPLDTADPETRRTQIIGDAALTSIVTSARLRDRIASLARPVCVDVEDPGSVADDSDDHAWQATSRNDLAYVMYTSGSTGTPKGVCVPHGAIVTLVTDVDYVTLGEQAVILQLAPASFDAATFEIWGALLTGGRVVVVPTPHPSLDQLATVIREHSVTTMFLTTALFRQVVDEHPDALRGVRELLTGGEMVSAAHFRKIMDRVPGLSVIHVYGPTECTTFASAYPCTRDTPIGDTVPIGRGIAGRVMYVLGDDGRPVAEGGEGEIFIGGDGVAIGYLQRPEATQSVFVADPSGRDPHARLYRTGDRGRWLPGGMVEFVGRTDRQVKIRGFRVELGEVEAAFRLDPAVRDVIATTEVNSNGSKDLVVHVLGEAEAGSADAVETWRQLYDDIIYQPAPGTATNAPAAADPTLNTVGWNSSYTGLPLSEEEMLEQVEAAVARIRARRPRRVLEIGCGTGMLLFRLAPDCETYVGTDISRTALAFVEGQLPQLVPPGRVRLIEGRADALPTGERFDAVILNSVVQHFPDVDYLHTVLGQAIALVDDGGFVFVGDVQSLRLLRMFHLSVELGRMSDGLSTAEVASLLDRRVREERHLVIDPAFFEAAAFERVSDVAIELKRGRCSNELTRFRYDAVLAVGGARPDAGIQPEDVAAPSDADLEPWLAATLRDRGGSPLRIRDLPNARLRDDVRAMALLESAAPPATVGALRERLTSTPPARAVDPEAVWSLAKDLGNRVWIGWSPDARDGSFDVTLGSRGQTLRTSDLGWRHYANQPRRKAGDGFAAELKRRVRDRVPPYMVPARIECHERWPLTANGKIDTAKLAQGNPRPPRRSDPTAVMPPHVHALAELWCEVLRVDSVGPDDNFFDLGGDSLKAIELVHRASRKFRVTLSPVSVFERPTLGALAALLAGADDPFDSDAAASAAAARARGAARRQRGGR